MVVLDYGCMYYPVKSLKFPSAEEACGHLLDEFDSLEKDQIVYFRIGEAVLFRLVNTGIPKLTTGLRHLFNKDVKEYLREIYERSR